MDLNDLNLRVRDPAASRPVYERHFGFRLTSAAEDGYFEFGDNGLLFALVGVVAHQPLPTGFHVGFGLPMSSQPSAPSCIPPTSG
jgi:hypothetical protein